MSVEFYHLEGKKRGGGDILAFIFFFVYLTLYFPGEVVYFAGFQAQIGQFKLSTVQCIQDRSRARDDSEL